MARTKKFISHPTDERLVAFPKEVQDLVKKGRSQGFITQEELLKAVPNAEDDVILLDEIYSLFLDCGVEVIDMKETDAMIWDKDKKKKMILQRFKIKRRNTVILMKLPTILSGFIYAK